MSSPKGMTTLSESPEFWGDGYTVRGNGRLVFKAESREGVSYALTPQKALDGLERLEGVSRR